MKARRIVIAFCAFSTLVGCTAFLKGWHQNAVFGDPEACELNDVHIFRSAPADLGNGIIAFESSSVMFSLGGGASSGLEVNSCSSGETLYIGATFSAGLQSDIPDFNRRDALTDFQSALGETLPATLQSVADMAVSFGLEPSDARVDGEESCGCAALYPELIGDRKPYYGRDR